MTLADRYVDTLLERVYVGYTLTNENPHIVRHLVSQIRPKRLAAVTGGGESVLLGSVPLGVETLGVDRAYNSVAATMAKGTLLERDGSGMKRIMLRLHRWVHQVYQLAGQPSASN